MVAHVALERPQVVEQTKAPEARPAKLDHRSTRSWLVFLVALGGVLRFWGLGASRLTFVESFTAMAGRLPVGGLFDFLRVHDSHPPLDYLLRAPLARAGLSEFWIRTPSALLSLGALALFAWWMRSWGRAGVIATALLAVSSFQVVHGREARMYADLELLGVAIAVLVTTWITRPRKWHAPALGALVMVGLLTHVSMFLLAGGLLAVAGLRTDREAWRWRAAIALGGLGWALTWGPSFLVQANSRHSAWIPPTTITGLGTAIGHLVTFEPTLAMVAAVATIAGGVLVCRRDSMLGRAWISCFAVPIGIAAIAGLFKPVVLDRTFTLMAWAPCVALAFLLDAVVRRHRAMGAVAIAAFLVVMLPATLHTIQAPEGPTPPLAELARVAKPGDIVAIRPTSRAAELAWSLGVRGISPNHPVAVPGIANAFGIQLGDDTASGRIWVLDWKSYRYPGAFAANQCATRWSWRNAHITCLKS
ncbi:MAG: hypothetical protein ACXVKA_07190 [Acidimicrobiia bacterium]